MNGAVSPSSAKEALGMLRSAMGYLAAADATAMAAETQAQCLQALEQINSMGTAARASILAAFTSGQGYCARRGLQPEGVADPQDRDHQRHRDGLYRVGPPGGGASAGRAGAGGGEMSESVARTICTWTDRLPGDCREAADTILVTAAQAGMDVRDLAGLAAEIYARSLPEDPGKDRDQAFEDRSVKLETTFDGAGVLHGDLTPQCAAVVTAVLDALSAPAGAEDTRSQAQRYHDALQEAMKRLVTAGLLPERAGQPVKVWAHISLADLITLDGSSALQQEWTARVRARWAAHRAGASAGGSDGGAWLDGDAATAMACDAAMAPYVTCEVDPGALGPGTTLPGQGRHGAAPPDRLHRALDIQPGRTGAAPRQDPPEDLRLLPLPDHHQGLLPDPFLPDHHQAQRRPAHAGHPRRPRRTRLDTAASPHTGLTQA
jgi:hypothetical protein